MGALVDADALPVYPETRTICGALRLDPLGLIASGSLLIAAAAGSAGAIVDALEAEHIQATVIGSVQEAPGVVLRTASGERPLPIFARDEIARLFDTQQ